ncbi:glycerophosphodiester phosphodiesterase family protein [Flavobacterium sp.]|uniref:glycerophosphodiester phosphodiesterase n=1 Tax=Flavobacterium sp. TaxID=239 RepID=UPI0025E1C348|nr:glycerophosphodiester phosphodiesterase family protein [Flavobacterium sp.]
MLKIGHRGATGYSAENTLEAFQKAIELGVDGIELDVHLSLDGKVMVIHDDTIDRTTSGKGFVKDFSSQELTEFEIPTLEAVFELINQQCFINIELKTFETAYKVVELIDYFVSEKNSNYADFIISSFDWNALQQIHFLNEEIPIGVLTNTDLELALAFAKFIKAYSIHPHYHLVTKENVIQMQSKNFKVFPWTVNEPSAITFVKSLNVDGIITDFPDRL